MKFTFCNTAFCVLLVLPMWAQAQEIPTNLTTNLQVRQWLKTTFYDGSHNTLGYTPARQRMYGTIDNIGDTVTDVYGGNRVYKRNGELTTSFVSNNINCEHTIPQSFFGSSDPMVSDIHHLYPSYIQWNTDRDNNPFDSIPVAQVTKWERLTVSQTTAPPVAEQGLWNKLNLNVAYEPRDAHKGNVARSLFYFFTMYPSQAGDISRTGNLAILRRWHELDPVDAAEVRRDSLVGVYQGNRNPFIRRPDWVYRAWYSTPIPIEFVSTAAQASEKMNVVSWSVNEKNIAEYTLQRSIDGAMDWQTVAQIPSKNLGTVVRTYSASDDAPFTRTYYRVRATENDGKQLYSKVVSVQRDETKLHIEKMINTSNDDTWTIFVSTNSPEMAQVTLTDAVGRLVRREKVSLEAGQTPLTYSHTTLANGIYLLQIEQGGQVVVGKLWK
jgi:hypothetical protein